MSDEDKTALTLGSLGKSIRRLFLDCFTNPKHKFVESTDFQEEIPYAEHRELIRAKFTKWPSDPELLGFVSDLEAMVEICSQKPARRAIQKQRGFSEVHLRFKHNAQAESARNILAATCSAEYMTYIGQHVIKMAPLMGRRVLHLGSRGFSLGSLIENSLMEMHYCVQTPSLKIMLRNDACLVRTQEDLSYGSVGAQISRTDNKKFWKLKSFLSKIHAKARVNTLGHLYAHPDETAYDILQETTRHHGRCLVKQCDQIKRELLVAVQDAKQHLTFDRAAPKLVSVVLTLEQHDYLLHLLQRIPNASKVST